MRKSLALILSIAMVFSMFSSLAFAADPSTAEEKYEALKAAGIFAGMEDGSAGLDQNMTRAQFARVSALLLDLDVDAKPSVSKFQDLPLTHWAIEEIHAIDAAGIMNGHGNMTFTPEAQVTIEQVARVLVDALGLEVDADAEVEGASTWAQGYVKAAVAAGLISADADFQAYATRELLVVSTYAAYEAIADAVPAGVVSATATGAKKITVQFGTVADTTKVAVTIKKGAVTTNVATTTFSDDKKSAVIETSTKLTAGDYTVTVTGLTETAQTAVVTAADEKVTKIEFTSLNAVLARGAAPVTTVTTKYVVSNQYGENISDDTDLTFSTGKGSASGDNGTLTLTSAGGFTKDEKINVSALHTGSSTFTSGVLIVVDPSKVSEIAITGIYHADGEKPEVGATVNEYYLLVDVKDQYGNAVTDTTYINDDVVVTNAHTNIFPAFSQLATPFVLSGAGGDKMALQLPGTGTGLFLAAGTAKVTIVSKSTGKLATSDVVVAETSKVDVLTLSQPSVAAAGDTAIEIPFTAVDQFGKEVTSLSTLTGTVTLSTSPSTTGQLAFTRDYVKGVNKLVLNTATPTALTGTVVITAVANGKVSMLTIALKDAKVPTVIAGVKDFAKTYAVGATDTLELADVIVHDQYGREITPAYGDAASEYQVKVVSATPGKVLVNGDQILTASTTVYGLGNDTDNDASTADDSITFSGVAKGTSTITLSLVKVNAGVTDTDLVASSSYTFTAKTVEKADIATYEVVDIAAVHTGGTAYDKDVTVNGVLASGDKVKLPNNDAYYTVSTSNTNVVFTGGKIHSNLIGDFNGDADTSDAVDVSVIVLISSTGGSQTVVKTVSISEVAPVLTTLSIVDNGVADKESDAIISVALASIDTLAELQAAIVDAVKTVDQYGVELTDTTGTYIVPTISNVTDSHTINGVNGASATTIVAGNSFEVTAVTTNGKYIAFKVIVK